MSLLDELHEHGQRPFGSARMLPVESYTSLELLDAELRELFARDWLCVGRAADITEPGDYITAEVPWLDGAPRSLIVLRSRDGEVRAFDNVCVHRGAQLLEGCGNEARITCPYHAWVYRLDGSLVGAPHMSQADERDGVAFDPAQHRLGAIRMEIWEGFIFVNQDDEASPLAPNLAGLHDVVARYAMADYVPVHEQIDVWDTNWKLLVENFMDAYHIFKVHQASFGASGDTTGDTEVYPGTDHWAHHRVVELGGPDHAHASNDRLMGPWRRTVVLGAVFPGFVVQLQPDWMWFLRITPLDTGRVRIAWQVSVAPDVLGGQTDRAAYLAELMELLHLVNSEDQPIVEGIRRSVHRPQFERGPMTSLERNVYDFDRYVSRRLGRADASSPHA